MVWNDGDGPDDVEGGAGVDTMEVNGAPDQSDEFVVEPTNCPTPPSCSVQLRAPAGLDIATSERLLVNGQRTHSDRRVAGGGASGVLGNDGRAADLACGEDRESGDQPHGAGGPQRSFGPDGRCD
jgi:hypothetical protein